MTNLIQPRRTVELSTERVKAEKQFFETWWLTTNWDERRQCLSGWIARASLEAQENAEVRAALSADEVER